VRLLTFNIWRSGGRSLDATIEVIRRARADVVALQECTPACAAELARELGMRFVADAHDHAVLALAPLGAHVSTSDPWGGLLVEVAPDVVVANVHLFWDDYGPYLLEDGCPSSEVMAREREVRLPGLEEMLDRMPARGAFFLAGDFNAPSHLDAPHRPWPTSLACEARGLADAWAVANPGAAAPTWTPLPEEEPRGVHDRIDFIWFHPRASRVLAAETLDERIGVPWPSDHRAVVATFAQRKNDTPNESVG